MGQERLLERANEKFEQYSFSPAIDIYKKVLDKGYVSAEVLKKLGNAYYFNADYKEAAAIFERLVKEFPENVEEEEFFKYAQSLKSLGDYDASQKVMDQFLEMTSGDRRALNLDRARDYMAEIRKNSGRYTISDFPQNTEYSEFAPSFYEQGLIFASDRDTGNLAKYRHTWNSKDFLDLYEIKGEIKKGVGVVKLGDNINTRLHESTSITTKDGNIMYFTRNNVVEGKYAKDAEGFIRLKIFRAKRIDGQWLEIEDLPFNSDAYSVAHPALSPDEKTLYFASDMPGSIGASDIFMVTINDDGTFGAPENLGPNINTEARETFPFVTANETLYFSSDGHPGLGGLDIFGTKIKRKDFTGNVMNVGEPANSNKDDFTYIIDEETKEGFFASNREGGLGNDDIYAFVENEPLIFDCVQKITGTVRDKISNMVLVGATVKVLNEDNEELTTTFTDSNGEYSLVLDCNQGNFVRALMEGYTPFEEYIGVSDGKPKIIDFYLERDQVTAGYGDDLAKLLQLSTIYFAFDKYDITKRSEIEIQKVIAAMEKYPSLKIKVNAHTDSRGPAAYNLWLSQKRAEATVAYMIAKGIAADRLSSEGYGETRPLNECVDGVRCSAEKHDVNRRSEFIIQE
ncbi:OmpA family protein [Maribacter sp. 2307ULW6-5]|uniref:OmpA family protein n=1 Tax=Maribacter sp. 2307ULW6-5 TaxID=3386275 RepID=UPI0039BD4D44